MPIDESLASNFCPASEAPQAEHTGEVPEVLTMVLFEGLGAAGSTPGCKRLNNDALKWFRDLMEKSGRGVERAPGDPGDVVKAGRVLYDLKRPWVAIGAADPKKAGHGA